MYLNGEGVPQDHVQAYKWLVLAAAQGDEKPTEFRDKLAEKMTPSQIQEGYLVELFSKKQIVFMNTVSHFLTED